MGSLAGDQGTPQAPSQAHPPRARAVSPSPAATEGQELIATLLYEYYVRMQQLEQALAERRHDEIPGTG